MLVHKVEDEPGRRRRAENPRQRMDLLVGARRSERRRVASVSLRLVEDERLIDRRIGRPLSHEPALTFFEDLHCRMGIGETHGSRRRQSSAALP